MQKRLLSLLAGLWAAIVPQMLLSQDKPAITAELLPQVLLNKSAVPPGDYSGISHIRGTLYAVVSDKEPADGFFPFTIRLDSLTGKIREVHRNVMAGSPPEKFTINNCSARDAEDIVYHSPTDTYFIAGEGDQRILEYDKDGRPTGRELDIPEMFAPGNIQPNYGFESLAYDSIRGLFWTTTESALKQDAGGKGDSLCLRLLAFGEDLKPLRQYLYKTDAPTVLPEKARQVFGVPALTALPDGRLLVMERDFVITRNYLRSYVNHKIYVIDPHDESQAVIPSGASLKALPTSSSLRKTLVAAFRTNLTLFDRSLANYEGMCLGPTLADGRQVLLLVNDSQHNYGNIFFHLQDYLKVILLKFQ